LTTWLTQPTNASNPNRFYVGATSVARAVTGDGGGLGTEKGGIFGGNDVATLAAAATRMAAIAGREINVGCETGSSVLDKYGLMIVSLSTDGVQGSRNDAAFFFGNQTPAIGWGTLIQVGDSSNPQPLRTTGSILAIKGAPTFANGIDLTGAGSITGNAFASPSFNVDGSGNGRFGNPVTGFQLAVRKADSSATALFAGTTKGIRIGQGAASSQIEGVDNTGTGSFQPLVLNGSTLTLQSNGGTNAIAIDASQNAVHANAVTSTGQGGVGYATGAGGTVTQVTSRTTGVTLNKITGAITLFTAAPSTTPTAFTVTNSSVAATDVVVASVKSANAANTYVISVTAVAAGSFQLSVYSQSGTASDAPVINFLVIKGAAS